MNNSAGHLARSGPSLQVLSARRATATPLRPLRPLPHRFFGSVNPSIRRPLGARVAAQNRANLSKRSYVSTSKPTEDTDTRRTAPLEDVVAPGSSADAVGEPATADTKTRSNDKKYYGSYRRRASRGALEVKLSVPDWFLTRNVRLGSEPSSDPSRLEVLDRSSSTGEPQQDAKSSKSTHAASASEQPHEDKETAAPLYQIDKVILDEISYMMLGGLRASSTSANEDSLNSRSHLLLQSPQEGAEGFLDAVVAHAAREQRIDLMVVEPQDIADIAGEAPETIPERSLSAIRRLGFDTYIYEDDQFSDPAEEDGDESSADADGLDEGLDVNSEDRGKPASFQIPGIPGSNTKPVQHMIQVWFPNRGRNPGSGSGIVKRPLNDILPNFFTSSNKADELYAVPELDPSALIRKFLDAPHLKREQLGLAASSETAEHGKSSAGLIVHIKDYLELSSTSIGGAILDRIHAVIDSKRREGHPVLIVGTSSSADLVPSISKSGFSAMQAGSDTDKFRTIVTTCGTPDVESIFVEDTKVRTAQINCRNILAILRELFPDSSQLDASLSQPNFGLTSEEMFQFDLAEEVWPLERVQRMVGIASGMLQMQEPMSGHILSRALGLMDTSDKVKFNWATQETKKSEPSPGQQTQKQEKQDEKMKALLKSCNRYEKKLLNGVVDGQKIKTTFADVHVPPTTVEALKTLTTLSLVRPEAFTYGVLATDKIPGLLLYGPPGTGKTLLAKAVAKESGATVLDIAGSDVYDMYVGEGEKNIRAIFTLARKLTPCVVFIDEADAIFGSRSSTHNRKSHRELINQFLREWDGMNDLSAFIMVATNRPFDLDDAVLRRLPRRLLVDLPNEQDRESILRIHLKDEALDSDVSLSDLATKTPYYSGSDLKNLSVAAALACVKEENKAAAAHTGSNAYQYPKRRTLRAEHFDMAMSEISASISEDMSTLAAIRKFDERFGDRQGIRKRSGGLGFGTASEKDREREKREAGRIRRSEATTE